MSWKQLGKRGIVQVHCLREGFAASSHLIKYRHEQEEHVSKVPTIRKV